MTDPFSLVYDTIVNAFRARDLRVVDYNGLKNPRHDVPSTSDFPELDIRPANGSFLLGNVSCSSSLVQSYNVVLNTGDLRLGALLFPYEWRIAKVLYALQYGGLDLLKYNSRHFVESVIVDSHVKGITDPSGSRPAVIGWAAQWVISVQMSFTSGDLTQ